MAPPKSLLVLAALLAVVAAAGLASHGAEAAAASATTSVRITGLVPCSAGTSIDVKAVPVFPNAGLQLVCAGKVVAGATADGAGKFNINLDAVATELLTVLLKDQCKVVVTTPLAACDASLAGVTGTLMAPLKLLAGNGGSLDLGGILGLVGQIIGGLVGGILSIVTPTFSLV